MAHRQSRREFVGSISCAGALSPAVLRAAASAPAPSPQIESALLAAAFDESSGRLHIGRRGGDALVSGALACAVTGGGVRTTGVASAGTCKAAGSIAVLAAEQAGIIDADVFAEHAAA